MIWPAYSSSPLTCTYRTSWRTKQILISFHLDPLCNTNYSPSRISLNLSDWCVSTKSLSNLRFPAVTGRVRSCINTTLCLIVGVFSLFHTDGLTKQEQYVLLSPSQWYPSSCLQFQRKIGAWHQRDEINNQWKVAAGAVGILHLSAEHNNVNTGFTKSAAVACEVSCITELWRDATCSNKTWPTWTERATPASKNWVVSRNPL